jgi:hypothetical protein
MNHIFEFENKLQHLTDRQLMLCLLNEVLCVRSELSSLQNAVAHVCDELEVKNLDSFDAESLKPIHKVGRAFHDMVQEVFLNAVQDK